MRPQHPAGQAAAGATARMQRALVVGAVLLALASAAAAWAAGHRIAAVACLAVLATAHATVLFIEFCCVAAVHRDDPAPRATVPDLLRAWWAETLYAPRVFCWRQPFRSRRWPDHVPADARGRRGVVLVHGFVCNRGLWNDWAERLTHAGVPFVAVNLEPVFGSIADYAAVIEPAVRRLEDACAMPPVVVAHSMGGLALRHWLAGHGGAARIHRAITLGTPHRGTWLARFATTANGREMQPGSPWLRALEAREGPDTRQRFTCFYSHCDNIVFPASNATLAGADLRHLHGVAHVHMVTRPEPWDELQRWLG